MAQCQCTPRAAAADKTTDRSMTCMSLVNARARVHYRPYTHRTSSFSTAGVHTHIHMTRAQIQSKALSGESTKIHHRWKAKQRRRAAH